LPREKGKKKGEREREIPTCVNFENLPESVKKKKEGKIHEIQNDRKREEKREKQSVINPTTPIHTGGKNQIEEGGKVSTMRWAKEVLWQRVRGKQYRKRSPRHRRGGKGKGGGDGPE